jgi:hypothetical protein
MRRWKGYMGQALMLGAVGPVTTRIGAVSGTFAAGHLLTALKLVDTRADRPSAPVQLNTKTLVDHFSWQPTWP